MHSVKEQFMGGYIIHDVGDDTARVIAATSCTYVPTKGTPEPY